VTAHCCSKGLNPPGVTRLAVIGPSGSSPLSQALHTSSSVKLGIEGRTRAQARGLPQTMPVPLPRRLNLLVERNVTHYCAGACGGGLQGFVRDVIVMFGRQCLLSRLQLQAVVN
jgi:hypothetical protein